jgi:hypothetical protein
MLTLVTIGSLAAIPGLPLLAPAPTPPVVPSVPAACSAVATEVVELLPTGKLALVGGTIELKPEMSPFGLALTPEGRPIYNATVTVKNLPSPSSLGPYAAFVVWLATPSLDQMQNLGPITNDKPITARVDFVKMMYMVTAEPAENVKGDKFSSGAIVLVGRSASARVQNMAGCDIYDTTGGMGG